LIFNRIHGLLTNSEGRHTTMSDMAQSAQIIPFPNRQRTSTDSDGQERLRRALAGLDSALADQRLAIASWRKALGELGTVVSGLGQSLQQYRGSLDTLGDRIAGLHTQSVMLERIADTALATQAE
jgi:phage shock protein A